MLSPNFQYDSLDDVLKSSRDASGKSGPLRHGLCWMRWEMGDGWLGVRGVRGVEHL